MNWKVGDIAICIIGKGNTWTCAITLTLSDGPAHLEENKVSKVMTCPINGNTTLYFNKYQDDFYAEEFRKKIDHTQKETNVNVEIQPDTESTPKREKETA